MKFLTFILVLVVIYQLVKWWLQGMVRNISSKMKEQQEQNNYTGKKEGDVTIQSQSDKEKQFKSNDGEYVDFEEVE